MKVTIPDRTVESPISLARPHATQETLQNVARLKPSDSTAADILAAYERDFSGRGRGGWRAIGEILGVAGGTAYEVAHGQRTLTHEQTLRWRVYQETIGRDNPNVKIIQTTTCPSCGQLHQVPDCHGQAGEVVIIPALPAPDAKPRPLRNRPPCWRPYVPARHRAALEPLIACWLAAQDEPAPPAWVSDAADWLQTRMEK